MAPLPLGHGRRTVTDTYLQANEARLAAAVAAWTGAPHPLDPAGSIVLSLWTLGWDDRAEAGTRRRPERYEACRAALHRWADQLSETGPTSAEDLEFILFYAAGDFSTVQRSGPGGAPAARLTW